MSATGPSDGTAASVSAPAPGSSSGSSPSGARWPRSHPDGFVLSHLSRDFFQAYYQQQHGRSIGDDEILALVNQAHDAAIVQGHPYRCIAEYQFCYPRVMLHPRYASLVQRPPDGVGSLRVLDVGSCMGSDLRQMLLHGVQPGNALGLEREQALIDIGLDVLYRDRPALQHSFTSQDVLAADFLTSNSQLAAFHEAGIDVIYCGSVYHLLDEEDSRTLSRHLYQLLKPGGVLFGRTVGSLDETKAVTADWHGRPRFLHSAGTFTAMMLQYGFVDATFEPTASDMGPSNPVGVTHAGFEATGNNLEQHATAMHAFYAKKAHS